MIEENVAFIHLKESFNIYGIFTTSGVEKETESSYIQRALTPT
jgi:hypothetical protein